MTPASPSVLILYRRPDCDLCDDARASLQAVLEQRVLRGEPVPTVRVVDVETDPSLEARYGSRVPVLALDGDELAVAVSSRQIRSFLDRTLGQLV